MTAQLDLLSVIPECVLPGCRNKVDAVGEPCTECLDLTTALGPLLRRVDGPALTEKQIADRDAEVVEAYRQQQLVVLEEAPVDTREWKANQLCWMCGERRRCARMFRHYRMEWECKACQEIE
jgi:hypothetical protein